MKKKVLKPKVVGKRGKAIPLGDNFYYMQGPKHKDGGIPIGKNPKTGIEVEGEEVMHITPKEVQVFSSVPFLNGESPAQKVLGGENPTKVFNQQENFKDRNNINDDGTKKKAMGGLSRKDDYGSSKKPYPKVKSKDFAGGHRSYPIPTEADAKDALKLAGLHGRNDVKTKVYRKYPNLRKKAKGGTKEEGKKKVDELSSTGERTQTFAPVTVRPLEPQPIANTKLDYSLAKTNTELQPKDKSKVARVLDTVGPNFISDVVGTGTNIAGSVIGYKTNKKMLNNLRYASQPTPRKANKLKTKININPQLAKLRETAAAYERDVDANTVSSAVALQRKQRARLAAMLDTNELYAKKENAETELINRDKMNQQAVADRNISEYNQWAKGRSEFANAIADKQSENKISMINNITNSVQDLLTRGESRRKEDRDMALLEITNPSAAKVLKDKGFESNRSKRQRRKNTRNNKD